jgi:hypothetical protein
VEAARSLVKAFNAKSQFGKLELVECDVDEDDRFACGISNLESAQPERVLDGRPISRTGRQDPDSIVSVRVKPVQEPHKIDGRQIRAWGIVRGPSGRGFNLLLVHEEPDDLYGRWMTIHGKRSVLVQASNDRPEPFPFDLVELANEIQMLHTIHPYQPECGTFSADMLIPLVAELLRKE